MIKKHEVLKFISSTIEDAVNKDIIPIIETEYYNNDLIVTFTEINEEKELIETKYRITAKLFK